MRGRIRWFSASLLTALLFACPDRSAANEADEWLKRYEQFLAGLRDLSFECLDVQYEKGEAFRQWTWIGTTKVTFVKRGEQWRFRIREIAVDYLDGRTMPSDTETEYVYGDDGNLHKVFRDYREARSLRGRFDKSDALKRLSIDGGPYEAGVRVVIEAETEDALKGYAIQNNAANVLYGYMPYDHKWLPDLMRDGALHARRVRMKEDEAEMIALESIGRYGRWELWLDPKTGHAPRRIRNEKRGSDLIGDREIGSLPAPEPMLGAEPRKALRALDFEVDFRPTLVDGVPMAAGYTRTDTLTREGGEQYQIRREVTFSDIRFDPDPSALARTLNIPEETAVSIENAPGIAARWQHGQIVQEYDNSVINRLSDIKFPGESSAWWRHPLLLANLFLLPLILATWWWRYRGRTTRQGHP